MIYRNGFPKQTGHYDGTPYYIVQEKSLAQVANIPKNQISYAIPIDGVSPKFKIAEGHADAQVILYAQSLWDKRHKNTPDIFNGDLLTVTQRITLKEGDPEGTIYPLKLYHNNFATVSASRGLDKDDNLPLRDHFASAVTIILMTRDDHIIIGSRGGREAKFVQFPGGFIGGEKDQTIDSLLENISQDPQALAKAIKDTVMKEGTEEIFKSFGGKFEYIGHIGKIFTHPCKTSASGTKKVRSIKSFVCTVKSDKTLEEIKQDRALYPPRDLQEMEVLYSIPIDMLHNMPPFSDILIGNKHLPFVAEYGHVLELFKKYILP